MRQDNLAARREAEPLPSDNVRTDRIGQLLFVAAQAAQSLAADRLERLGLTPRGWGVLSTLVESGPLTQIQLATGMAIDRTAMVYLIDDLESAGLVSRVRSPKDRRAFAIHLTAAGRSKQRKAAAEMGQAALTLLAPLDGAEQLMLRGLLARVVDGWQSGRQRGGPLPASARDRRGIRIRRAGHPATGTRNRRWGERMGQCDDLDGIADADAPGDDRPAVQPQLAVESSPDRAQHVEVLDA